jgi:hypothetical protein
MKKYLKLFWVGFIRLQEFRAQAITKQGRFWY